MGSRPSCPKVILRANTVACSTRVSAHSWSAPRDDAQEGSVAEPAHGARSRPRRDARRRCSRRSSRGGGGNDRGLVDRFGGHGSSRFRMKRRGTAGQIARLLPLVAISSSTRPRAASRRRPRREAAPPRPAASPARTAPSAGPGRRSGSPHRAADHELAVGPRQGLDHARRGVARHHGAGRRRIRGVAASGKEYSSESAWPSA